MAFRKRIDFDRVRREDLYPQVAKKVGLPVEMVAELYEKYMSMIVKYQETNTKVLMAGLGSIKLDAGRILNKLWKFGEYLEDNPDEYVDEITKNQKIKLDTIKYYFTELEKLKKIYGYIEGSLEKLRLNNGRFNELIDNEGNCRVNFRVKDGDMQEMPL